MFISAFSVKFISPKFSPRRFCTLSFAYKMFGIPRANLTILVLEDDDIAKHTGELFAIRSRLHEARNAPFILHDNETSLSFGV